MLDGFPRTVAQAQTLDTLLGNGDALVIVDLAVSAADLIRRLSRRRVCAACGTIVALAEAGAPEVSAQCGGALAQRSDDREEVGARASRGLRAEHRAPSWTTYRERASYRTIDGAQSPDAGSRRGSGRDRRNGGGDRAGSMTRLQVPRRSWPACKPPTVWWPTCWPSCRGIVGPGVTTRDLDVLAEARVRSAGAIPAFKGYQGYPATLCTSVNDAVVHGIPSDAPLKDGDIVSSIDLGVVLDGY